MFLILIPVRKFVNSFGVTSMARSKYKVGKTVSDRDDMMFVVKKGSKIEITSTNEKGEDITVSAVLETDVDVIRDTYPYDTSTILPPVKYKIKKVVENLD